MVDIVIERRPRDASISDVELCSSVTESKDTNDVFYKNNFRVIPNPSLLFGSSTFPVVFTYSELYNLKKDFLYEESSRILDYKGEVVKEKKRLRKPTGMHIVDVAAINITSLVSGKYKLVLTVSDTLGHEYARSEKQLYISNPRIIQSSEELINARTAA